ncbi:substrate-binding domain-containing protein [Streptomyces sp. NBC_01727]|uniref:substrate-binding domain-containing protein n=1 Tax=unclassified Streptomyces TaxID=2593676 RepID=UPI002E0D6FB3|nr:substrate-binding domain-containing protein [Streptomyces sp. NBC_01727]
MNDRTAVGALRAACEQNLWVPADLSITGFDDTDPGRSTVPRPPTARQPSAEVGRMAVPVLMRLLERHTVETPRVRLVTHLVLRDSMEPAPRVRPLPRPAAESGCLDGTKDGAGPWPRACRVR